MTILQIV